MQELIFCDDSDIADEFINIKKISFDSIYHSNTRLRKCHKLIALLGKFDQC